MNDANDITATAGTALARAQRILVFTGAGISTESGIPDFRGPNGVWRHRDPAHYTLQRYLADPDVRRERWQDRLEAARREHRPNDAHVAITQLQQAGRAPVVVTQNIDGPHQDAGTRNVIELHGTSREVGCLECGRRLPVDVVLDRVREGDSDPHCELCGGLLKTATISFGQNLIAADIEAAMHEADLCDACIAIGSTLSVWPAAGVPARAAHNGVPLVIVNDGATELDAVAEVVVSGRAGTIVPALVESIVAAG
ncbi:MAG: NAD-dependent deacetylase [Candidatus Dormibacteraeota bacterium]|nr:NAD-dependent deacetylase [Candidatus Dormibacteraeota bacterium]